MQRTVPVGQVVSSSGNQSYARCFAVVTSPAGRRLGTLCSSTDMHPMEDTLINHEQLQGHPWFDLAEWLQMSLLAELGRNLPPAPEGVMPENWTDALPPLVELFSRHLKDPYGEDFAYAAARYLLSGEASPTEGHTDDASSFRELLVQEPISPIITWRLAGALELAHHQFPNAEEGRTDHGLASSEYQTADGNSVAFSEFDSDSEQSDPFTYADEASRPYVQNLNTLIHEMRVTVQTPEEQIIHSRDFLKSSLEIGFRARVYVIRGVGHDPVITIGNDADLMTDAARNLRYMHQVNALREAMMYEIAGGPSEALYDLRERVRSTYAWYEPLLRDAITVTAGGVMKSESGRFGSYEITGLTQEDYEAVRAHLRTFSKKRVVNSAADAPSRAGVAESAERGKGPLDSAADAPSRAGVAESAERGKGPLDVPSIVSFQLGAKRTRMSFRTLLELEEFVTSQLGPAEGYFGKSLVRMWEQSPRYAFKVGKGPEKDDLDQPVQTREEVVLSHVTMVFHMGAQSGATTFGEDAETHFQIFQNSSFDEANGMCISSLKKGESCRFVQFADAMVMFRPAEANTVAVWAMSAGAALLYSTRSEPGTITRSGADSFSVVPFKGPSPQEFYTAFGDALEKDGLSLEQVRIKLKSH
ncbi:hypothetical protein [Streptomyces chartreusis]|uniref:hypothetical protein n=1 Tax=Streptomyces chartreusis TaxID=1969 RepID=UPI00343B296F